jgi:hypothetical protein
MPGITASRTILAALAAAVVAMFAGPSFVADADAATKRPAAAKTMKIKLDGKTIKVDDKADLKKVSRKLAADGQLRKNWGRVRFNIWTHLRGYLVDCGWGAVHSAVNTTRPALPPAAQRPRVVERHPRGLLDPAVHLTGDDTRSPSPQSSHRSTSSTPGLRRTGRTSSGTRRKRRVGSHRGRSPPGTPPRSWCRSRLVAGGVDRDAAGGVVSPAPPRYVDLSNAPPWVSSRTRKAS